MTRRVLKAWPISQGVACIYVFRVVNACSKRAPALGANLGVVALLFSINERLLNYMRDKDDCLNPIAAASLTGTHCAPAPCEHTPHYAA